MERNLESIIEEIAQNEKLSKEFMAMDEIDEIYAYCKELGLNSSEEEFDEEVSSMIDNFDLNYSKIGDFELENVAGGSMLDKKFNKVVASALSALTIVGASAANSNFASAANASSASTNVKSSSKMEYTKEKFNEIKNSLLRFCKKHKIAVGVTTAAIILAVIYTCVAVHKGSANPLRRSVNNDQNGQSNESTSAESTMTAEVAKRDVSVWLIGGDLKDVPTDAIQYVFSHSEDDKILGGLSRQVTEKMEKLGKMASQSADSIPKVYDEIDSESEVNLDLADADADANIQALRAFIQYPTGIFPMGAYVAASESESEEVQQLAQQALELADTSSAKHGSD